jgi:hypothetical protein
VKQADQQAVTLAHGRCLGARLQTQNSVIVGTVDEQHPTHQKKTRLPQLLDGAGESMGQLTPHRVFGPFVQDLQELLEMLRYRSLAGDEGTVLQGGAIKLQRVDKKFLHRSRHGRLTLGKLPSGRKSPVLAY